MRKFLAVVAAALATVGLAVGTSSIAEARPRPKVTVCHRTHSARHPWVQVRVREGGPHSRHQHDFVLTGGTCANPDAPDDPVEETTTTTEPEQLPG